jgi:hypothetical protein
MKVAWVSVLGVGTASGSLSARLAEALGEFSSVELWAADPPPWHAVAAPVAPLVEGIATGRLAAADDRIYVLVDEPGAAAQAVYHALASVPGHCLLHDRSYERLSAALSEAAPAREDDDGRSPFDDAILASTRGALVRSEEHLRSLESRWFGPVGLLGADAGAGIMRFLADARRWQPALDLVERVTWELGTMGVSTASPSISRIAVEIATVTGR